MGSVGGSKPENGTGETLPMASQNGYENDTQTLKDA